MHSGNRTAQHASFILVAEFDIGQGTVLAHQYPYPTGIDEHILAELMIPEGVHAFAQDWTIFFLNQTPENTVTNVFAPGDDDDDGTNSKDDKKELLYVLNLVMTRHDPNVKRGAIVKAMAICTHYPFIQIFKAVLVIALGDYYSNPGVECLARLFDAINAMDTSLAPTLSRDEKLICRASERRDAFAEKFVGYSNNANTSTSTSTASRSLKLDRRKSLGHRKSGSGSGSQFSFTGTRKLSAAAPPPDPRHHPIEGHGGTRSRSSSITSASEDHGSSMVGSAIWVGGEDNQDTVGKSSGGDSVLRAKRMSLDRRSSLSSSLNHHDEGLGGLTKSSSDEHNGTKSTNSHIRHPHNPHPHVRDTQIFDTSISYLIYHLPIRMPTSTFPEEVGDFSLVQLIQTFSAPGSIVAGPLHPHLHTQGQLTPPIILLFNALITQKRIIFMGRGKSTGLVAQYVLAACALGSGSGCYLRGFTERAFPHGHLSIKTLMESIPGFIAGVTNPIYESMPIWDVLCNIETGKITVHKDISLVSPPTSLFPPPPPLINPRSGVIAAIGDDDGKTPIQIQPLMGGGGAVGGIGNTVKGDANKKEDSYDAQFMEELLAAISLHYGETMVRARVSEYVHRFLRIAARYEENLTGSTDIGFSCQPFSETGVSELVIPMGMGIAQGFGGSLGSGIVLADENVTGREMSSNSSRIEGWRGTKCYEYWSQDFQAWLGTRAIQGFDLHHQISRLRNAKNIQDAEMDLIVRSLYAGVRTYDQIVELLSVLPPYTGGLVPISFGLFHPSERIRETTADVLDVIRSQNIGSQFIQSLNHFHRFAYIQMLTAREQQLKEQVTTPLASSTHQQQDHQHPSPPYQPTQTFSQQQRPSISSTATMPVTSNKSLKRETISGSSSFVSSGTNPVPLGVIGRSKSGSVPTPSSMGMT